MHIQAVVDVSRVRGGALEVVLVGFADDLPGERVCPI